MTKKIEAFNGFTPETIQFLKDLKENNYKEWFEEHRHVYEKELLNPFKSLITTLSPAMYNIDPTFEMRPHRVMSRIYRDVRFSKNKDPYKTSLWLTFQPPMQAWENYPGFFMDLNDTGYVYGMGLYMPKKKVMDNFRENVEYNPNEFQEITQKTVLDRGFNINGDDYKRPLQNSLPEYFQPWMQKKNVWVGKSKPVGDELFSARFADLLREDFQSLEWLYNFFKEALD
ncbi:DUF2461 domain-containing protein [Dysgonomonas sp. 520]|uniref:DUF2461 domain-containing protein n=1 Tax=Dysgonomonas sp. 520 TaxID=2302931 RepID=UPI0013D60624|nr:DUF2461 domain-containing protein [Dysgonomonas sp. 520]NDW10028.1 DUF2461 domain-containing protein [Dysgonomonas sp. 520]